MDRNMKKRSDVVERAEDRKAQDDDDTKRTQEIDDLFSMGTLVDSNEQPVAVPVNPPQPAAQAGGALPPPVPVLFEQASGGGRPDFPPLPDLQRGFQEIVRELFEGEGLDVLAEYRTIQDALSIKGALTPGNVQLASNMAEQMADRAYRLYLIALNEYSAYMREIMVIEAALRDSATARLELEKANKVRTKQITEADVDSTIAQLHPDEWDDVQRRKGNAKGMLDYLNNLSVLAKSRCFSVSNMQRGNKM